MYYALKKTNPNFVVIDNIHGCLTYSISQFRLPGGTVTTVLIKLNSQLPACYNKLMKNRMSIVKSYLKWLTYPPVVYMLIILYSAFLILTLVYIKLMKFNPLFFIIVVCNEIWSIINMNGTSKLVRFSYVDMFKHEMLSSQARKQTHRTTVSTT